MNRFSITGNQTISTAITILELTAQTARPLRVVRIWLHNGDNDTSTQERVNLIMKTGTITGDAITPRLLSRSGSAVHASAKDNASAEGTDGDVLDEYGFNTLAGWDFLPVPDEIPDLQGGDIIAIKFPAVVPSSLWMYGMHFVEIG